MTGLDLTLVPSAPYATGGNHFSNGKTWIEQLAGAVGLSVKPAFAGSDGRASNYAVGGATAADLTAFGGNPFHLGVQVGAFLTDVEDSLRRTGCMSSKWAATISGRRFPWQPGRAWRGVGGGRCKHRLLYERGARKFWSGTCRTSAARPRSRR